MSEPRTFFLRSRDIRMRAATWIMGECPEGWSVACKPATRSIEQNARLWATLTEIAEHVSWHGQKLTKEEWKDVFTASLKRQKVVPGIDGGFVVLGSSTSRMSKAEVSELMELIAAFGAQRGVEFAEHA